MDMVYTGLPFDKLLKAGKGCPETHKVQAVTREYNN